MTKIKLLLLLIVGFLGFTTTANADFGEMNSYFRPSKLSVYGHTGQDPVHKKFGGENDIPFPFGKKPNVNAFITESISDMLIKELDQNNPILLNPFASGDTTLFEFSSSFNSIDLFSNASDVEGAVLGAIPTPPAFLLLACGLFYRKRRTA